MNTHYRGIFVSDLDGTLLRQGTMSRQDLDALAELKSEGILRVIATGRSLHSATLCLHDEFPTDYLILSTGNQVIDWPARKVLQTYRLGAGEVREVCKLLVDMDVNFMLHDDFPDNHCFAFHRGRQVNEDFERRLARNADHARGWDPEADPAPASQALAIVSPEETGRYDHIRQALSGYSVVRATSPLDGKSIWVEIFAHSVSKAAGITHIMKHHGLEDALLGAIGNDHNDKEMLDLVHLPYIVIDAFIDPGHNYISTPAARSDAVAFAVSHFMEQLHSGMTQR